jgi:hypothetical protein
VICSVKTARPPQYDELIARRNAILDKRSLDEQDRMALDKLESRPSCRSANCMIAVHKPGASPEILETRGREENACNQKAYEKAPADYDSGTLTLSFRADLYGHDSVKEALIAAQHGKCCFCESKLSGYYYADFVKGDPARERDDPARRLDGPSFLVIFFCGPSRLAPRTPPPCRRAASPLTAERSAAERSRAAGSAPLPLGPPWNGGESAAALADAVSHEPEPAPP